MLAEALNGTTVVGSATGGFTDFTVPVPNARRWSPDDPFLYNLRVTLRNAAGATVDQTMHYFGMREIATGLLNGVLRPKLNGQFVFQIGTLDQGFWPDGLYTAPTDAALAFDLQKHKDLGFNMVRKHIKVEPQRWFYHADRLGLLVWQDMPSLTAQNIDPTNAQQAQFEAEATRDRQRAPQLAGGHHLRRLQRGLGRAGAGRHPARRPEHQEPRPDPAGQRPRRDSTAASPWATPATATSSTGTFTPARPRPRRPAPGSRCSASSAASACAPRATSTARTAASRPTSCSRTPTR